MQLAHNQICNKVHSHKIILVLEYLQSPENIGLILRTAEGMGVEIVYIVSKKLKELTPRIKRITRSVENYLDIRFCDDISLVLRRIKEEGYKLIALEKTSDSINYKKIVYETPCAIICGNEVYGISKEVLSFCDLHLHINMYGRNTSLNVAVATSIVLSYLV